MIVQNGRSFRAGRIGTARQGCAASNAPFCGAPKVASPQVADVQAQGKPEGRMFRRIAALTMAICLGALAAHAGERASERSPTMGETHPADVVLARRILMAGIGRNMDEITGVIEDAAAFNLGEAREQADVISTMLLAFPHLFPVETDTWSEKLAEDDPAHVSLALSTVWQNYDDFVARAQQASQIALDASFATTADQFKALAKGLQQACDSCHQAYRRP
jgi:cytochrome c556